MTTITIRSAVRSTLALLLVSGLMPALAAASTGSGQSPPGNSAINQYVESIPTAGGGKPTRGLRSHHGGRGNSGAVSPSTARAMSNRGGAGPDALAFANTTAPSGSPGS